MSINHNTHMDNVTVECPPPFRTNPVRAPKAHQSQGKELCHTTTSRGPSKDAEVIDKDHSTTNHTTSSRGSHRATPPQQPPDRYAIDSETRLDAERFHGQRYASTKSYPTVNQEEFFIDQDARLIPDRGKRLIQR